MPYVSVNTSQHLSEEKTEIIQREIGRIISIIPGKTIDNCMIQINGDNKIFMSGKPANAVFVEVRMFGNSPNDKKKEFTEALDKVLTAEIEGLDRTYVNFQEYTEWGVGPNYRDS